MTPLTIQSITVPLIGPNYLSDSPNYTPMATFIQQIVATGANDVRIVVSAGTQARYTDNQIDPTIISRPPDAELLSFASQLKAAGLTITLAPFVNVSNTVSGGGGADRPQPTDLALWVNNHAADMVGLARLAQQMGAERFTIFSDEVQHIAQQPVATQGWLSLIDQVRSVYSGTLTTLDFNDGTRFPGGATSHAQLIPKAIWDKIDLIGIGLYPGAFTNSTDPTVDDLIAAWRHTASGLDAVAFLKSISDYYGKPVWLADQTFHSFDGDNISHNRIFGSEPLTVDQQEQADQYEAFFRVWTEQPWMRGVSFQNYNRLPDYTSGVGRYLDSIYGENIQGKLAEAVLTRWFAHDLVDGGAANDVIRGGDGNDLMRGLDGNDSVYGDAGDDDVNGNRGEDVVRGGTGADTVRGGQGNDTVYGEDGDDGHVNGNIGDDIVYGGAGNDTLYGGQGSDNLLGEAGNDLLSGDLGNDFLGGGAGADRFTIRAGGGVDLVTDFNAAEGDRVQLAPGTAYTAATVNGSAAVDLGGGTQLVLLGVTALAAEWVVFA